MSADSPRTAVFVAGSGRSGTSTLAISLRTLGLHIPLPEVAANNSNPKGFGEPKWMIDFHGNLLKRANVTVSDARPQAWDDTAALSSRERLRERAQAWLEAGFPDGVDEIVVKDPRLAWFLDLWRVACERSSVQAAYAVMLRPPTEVVGSKQKYYSYSPITEGSEVACWVNLMLHTEQSTRGQKRAFVRYYDLLEDWQRPIHRLAASFDLRRVQNASPEAVQRVHDFIDPDLRRVRATWDDLRVPAPLQRIAEELWQQLDRLADEDGDTDATHAALDEIGTAYTTLYEESEAVAQSTALAQRRAAQARLRKTLARASASPSADEPTPADVPPPSPAARLRGLLRRG